MHYSQITFIIPAYKRAHFLIQALRSIYQQTILPQEVIVIDDGSPRPLSEKIAPLFPTVIWIRKEKNEGPSSARNMGLEKAKGKYICLLDSDDVLHPLFSQKMLWTIKKNKKEVPAVCCSKAIFTSNYQFFMKFAQSFVNTLRNTVLFTLFIKNHGYLEKEAFFAVTLSRLLIPKQLIGLVRFNEKMKNCEDWEFVLKLMYRTKIKILPKNLVYYRFDKNSFTYFERKRTGWSHYDALLEKLSPASQNHPLILGFKFYKNIFSKI